MARRSWRNFDYALLAALIALSAFGLMMIYSATVGTGGVENAFRRQGVFLLVGLAVLLFAASVDYRLLELAQHPFRFLVPLVVGLGNAALVVAWQAKQLGSGDGALTLASLSPSLVPILAGCAMAGLAFLVDRTWLEKLDLVAARLLGVAILLGGVAAVFLLVRRLEGDRLRLLTPYLLAGAGTALYLLDCLTLRITDALRNLLYILVLALLASVLVAGRSAGGSQSWLGAGTVQPSELSKILVIAVLAKYLADHADRMEQLGTVLSSLGLVVIPMALIYQQPDLGTALVFVAIWAAMIWMAGIRLRHLLALLGAGLVVLPLAWLGLADYMRTRLLVFLNPASDPDSYFNVHQALVSIGSGGWFGKGLTHGTQSQLHFLRVRHTDFIFAVTAEELGFFGAALMIALLFFIIWRVLVAAGRSRDLYGRLIASGVAAVLLFQIVVNIGMNLALLPVTGIPLPFVSYGGSSLVTLFLGVGLVESVAMRHKKLEFD